MSKEFLIFSFILALSRLAQFSWPVMMMIAHNYHSSVFDIFWSRYFYEGFELPSRGEHGEHGRIEKYRNIIQICFIDVMVGKRACAPSLVLCPI